MEIYIFNDELRKLILTNNLFFRFCMVFACLVLTVYSTIEEYEQVASAILLKMVINFCINFINFD